MNDPSLLTKAVERARSGLRADVQALIDALQTAELILPLARRLPGWWGSGARRHVVGGLQLTPHMMADEQGRIMLPAFSCEEPIARFASTWRTDGGPLQIVKLPALSVLELAEMVVDGTQVVVLILDPGAPSELGLRRAEIQSVRAGRARPLVEYTRRLPRSPVLASEQPPVELVAAVGRALGELSGVVTHQFERWFDPERGLQPRLVITARVRPEADQRLIADSIVAAAPELTKESVELHFETVA